MPGWGPPYRPQSWPSVCTKYFQDVSVSFRISADFYLCRFHQPFLCVYLILKVASVQFDGHTPYSLFAYGSDHCSATQLISINNYWRVDCYRGFSLENNFK